ncbi:DMT family transporter [Litchfieldia salsa]|uniref:Permease of the drug/metabolite transporter (DMT) superfamily n=1 Tax=Litchfieldia salsa TaxID=930152 RepID=A0A1H0TA78_9BACI|nr:DMT family transporter [Litchfieldia salsa]SDP50518.1 Permease of the drug/metabolite transporter (DMT) superfamily [Litchfieldia salsa]
MEKKLWLTYGMLTLATATWGSAFIAGKVAIQSFEPSTIAFIRFFGAALLLFPLMWLMDKEKIKPTLKDYGLFAVLGLTGIAIYNICFFLSSKHAPVIKSSLFIASNPVLIVLLSGLFLKEKITQNNIIGMLIALTGVTFIITDGHLVTLLQMGFEPIDFILLGAVISWALYSVVGKIVLKKYSSVVSTTYAVAFGTIFLFPFAILETSWLDIQQAPFNVWIAIAHMSVFVTVVSFVMYYHGIKEVGAAKASIFINVMPLSAVIMATLFLGETFTWAHAVGAICVLTGVYVGTQTKKTNLPKKKLEEKVVS